MCADKEMIVCETALTSFQSILKTVGGPSEKLRAEKLLQQVTVVPDQVSSRTHNISKSAKINQRTKVTLFVDSCTLHYEQIEVDVNGVT